MSQSVRLQPLFGINIDPNLDALALSFNLARYADQSGLDLIGIQDHPYNGAFLETWTLLTFLGAMTKHVRLLPNVANLPLRPPAMLGKAAATLDILTGGRVELGLGAGGLWDAIAGYGGLRRTPGEAVDALEEAIEVLHLIWGRQGIGQRVSFTGQYYQLERARPGPQPVHQIGIWLGALKSRMLRLTGHKADGWSVSHNWVPPEQIPDMQRMIDDAAAEAGRAPSAIRRNYNLMGVILAGAQPQIRARRQGMIFGEPSVWIDAIVRFATELGMDSFIFWPIAGDVREQMRWWAEEVVPAVREQLTMAS